MGLFGTARAKAAGGLARVESWMGVFFGYAYRTPVADEAQLRELHIRLRNPQPA